MLKIALIGEFSGVHAGLKKGLEELGHHVDIYSDGDGFKKIKSNEILYPRLNGFFEKIIYYIFGILKLFKFIANEYDIIQIANPHVINSIRGSPFYYGQVIKRLSKTKAVKSLAVIGCEANTQRELSALARSPCPGCLKDYKLKVCPFSSGSNKKIIFHAEKFADHIIPFGGPSYAKSYLEHHKSRGIVPFPLDMSNIPYRKNYLNGKIRVLHGINRYGFKGSNVVLSALNKVKINYPDFFEIIVPDRLPFDKYLELLSTTNVVVDQLYGDGLGMNALYSMSASCVVFTCFDRIKIGNLDLTQAPAIQLGESVDDIYEQITNLKLWSCDQFIKAGENSRQFVFENNSPVKVAKQIFEYWGPARNAMN